MSTETEIWKGTSSQVKNFWWFVACILVIPIPWAIWNYLKVKSRVYTLTTERLLIDEGVFNKTQDTLELYRVRDIQVKEPFLLRLFGLQNSPSTDGWGDFFLMNRDGTDQHVIAKTAMHENHGQWGAAAAP